jgi:hypothetical protein
MKRTLRKKAVKKAETHNKIARTTKHKHTEGELFLLFAAVLALFFAVLCSQILTLFLNYDSFAQKKINALNDSLNNFETRLSNESVLDQLDSFKK